MHTCAKVVDFENLIVPNECMVAESGLDTTEEGSRPKLLYDQGSRARRWAKVSAFSRERNDRVGTETIPVDWLASLDSFLPLSAKLLKVLMFSISNHIDFFLEISARNVCILLKLR